MRILLTGGCGFIGSTLVKRLIYQSRHDVYNLDALTYSGDVTTVAEVADDPRYQFLRSDITDADAVRDAFERVDPDIVVHLAAESHVDRSILGPAQFVRTNVVGTFNLLDAAARHWDQLSAGRRESFRFVHVSTDEVFGELGESGAFTESTPYAPRSPYSATKAGSDHLARAWHATFGLPVIVTNCSNNYGPWQYPEKLIPVVILNALAGEPIPVYGEGLQIRDWLYVEDHAEALHRVMEHGEAGQSYNIGGAAERRNIDVVLNICSVIDQIAPRKAGMCADLVRFVEDRKGHDYRYAIDATYIDQQLDWRPRHSFDDAIRATVGWYLKNLDWAKAMRLKSARLDADSSTGRVRT